jgi:hypothetical protein
MTHFRYRIQSNTDDTDWINFLTLKEAEQHINIYNLDMTKYKIIKYDL